MKYAWIDNYRDQYVVSQLCRVLGVSRSGYCQWRVRPADGEWYACLSANLAVGSGPHAAAVPRRLRGL